MVFGLFKKRKPKSDDYVEDPIMQKVAQLAYDSCSPVTAVTSGEENQFNIEIEQFNYDSLPLHRWTLRLKDDHEYGWASIWNENPVSGKRLIALVPSRGPTALGIIYLITRVPSIYTFLRYLSELDYKQVDESELSDIIVEAKALLGLNDD